jgi:hypothetical protein
VKQALWRSKKATPYSESGPHLNHASSIEQMF